MVILWKDVLGEQKHQEYFQKLMRYVEERRKVTTVFPATSEVFQALKLTEYYRVKVVILGQDPYHGQGQAHGLSFSVPDGIPLPPSLQNIFQELTTDLQLPAPKTGNLTSWARQGVLLLNTVLTVEAGRAYSHQGQGWEIFTDAVIRVLNQRPEPMIFVLWGRPAQKKQELITNPQHVVFTAPHPSPLSAHRGFFGSKPFSRINEQLCKWGYPPIKWTERE